MRIAVASDHAGFQLKQHVKETLELAGHQIVDMGTDSPTSADYPPFAAAAARLVADGSVERGILVCGSGNGVTITANKIEGVRAVNAHDSDEAVMARRHNAINVLGLSEARISPEKSDEIVSAFLNTPFDGGRHERRVDEITDIEQGGDGEPPEDDFLAP